MTRFENNLTRFQKSLNGGGVIGGGAVFTFSRVLFRYNERGYAHTAREVFFLVLLHFSGVLGGLHRWGYIAFEFAGFCTCTSVFSVDR